MSCKESWVVDWVIHILQCQASTHQHTEFTLKPSNDEQKCKICENARTGDETNVNLNSRSSPGGAVNHQAAVNIDNQHVIFWQMFSLLFNLRLDAQVPADLWLDSWQRWLADCSDWLIWLYVCGCGSSSKGAKFNGDTGDMQHAVTLRVCLAVRQLGHSG